MDKKKADNITGKTMVKKVRIHAPIAVRTVNPIIQGDIKEVCMSPANILKCLIARASVWEIMPDGSLLKLNERNYNTVNKSKVKIPQKPQTLVKDKNKSAIEKNKISGYNTIVLNDTIEAKESINNHSEKVVDSKDAVDEDDSIKISSSFIDDKSDEKVKDEVNNEMTDEERELAALEAEIAKLDEEEASKNS